MERIDIRYHDFGTRPFLNRPRVLFVAIGFSAILTAQAVWACAGSGGSACVFNSSACQRSVVLAKGVPRSWVASPSPQTVDVPVMLYLTCPTNNYCGVACPGPASVVSASITVGLYPGLTPPPPGPLPSPVAAGFISTAGATMPLPTCAPIGSGFNSNAVPVNVPGSLAPGFYTAVGMATVAFADGMVLTQRGDTTVCIVEPAPGQPGVPRLDLQLITPPVVRAAPGDQTTATYRITNNDPSNSVALIVTATTKQSAVRPQGSNEGQGVFSISSPFGDDFPIQFNPGTNCIPLPPHPYTQSPIITTIPPIGPGQSNTITVGIRSHGQCASGSSSESTLRVQGNYSPSGSLIFGAAGAALVVDTSMPTQNCGAPVNDCNVNGIPDAVDIATHSSQDMNFNAMPDECEATINIPFSSSVTPGVVLPGSNIFVLVAFNEAVPMSNVWANGSSLVKTQLFTTPFWVGTIPADTRPGPQTVYFLGKDQAGGLSTFIAPYQVEPLKITAIAAPPNGNAVLEHNGASLNLPVYVEEVNQLPGTWVTRSNGPHASPHDAGPATGVRHFRLSTTPH